MYSQNNVAIFMKKTLLILLFCLLFALTGCGKKEETTETKSQLVSVENKEEETYYDENKDLSKIDTTGLEDGNVRVKIYLDGMGEKIPENFYLQAQFCDYYVSNSKYQVELTSEQPYVIMDFPKSRYTIDVLGVSEGCTCQMNDYAVMWKDDVATYDFDIIVNTQAISQIQEQENPDSTTVEEQTQQNEFTKFLSRNVIIFVLFAICGIFYFIYRKKSSL